MTWRMNSVPSVWGPEHSMWARCMEGVSNAAAHCSKTAGSHSWLCIDTARLPTFWSNHSASRWRAGLHSWDWAEQAQRWGAVSGCAPQRGHVVSSTVLRWDDRCAKTVIVGMLSTRCADMAMLVTVEPVEEEATPWRVVCSPLSLISNPCRNGGLFLQPVAQGCRGKMALVPVGHRGEKGEGAAEEPCEIHLRWLLRRRIHANVEVRDPMRRRGDHMYGRGWGEAAALQDRGIQMVYAIPTVAPLLVSTEGPRRRFGVQHLIVQARLLGQPLDVRQEDHGLSFLGGAHSGGNVGPVGPMPTLGDPCHSHARQRRPSIYRGYSSAEGCQFLQVMEPNTWFGVWG